MNLPVFPLPIFLMPEGVTRLRIFEPRYLKMVKLATTQNGFVILLNDQNKMDNTNNWASWVDIVNFDQGEDGMLNIDVKCKALVTLSNMTQDKDKLHHSDVRIISHWPAREHDEVTQRLSASLLSIFEQNKELSALYQDVFIDKPNWVLSRWLEFIPVSLKTKSSFAEQGSFYQAKQFIEDVVIEK